MLSNVQAELKAVSRKISGCSARLEVAEAERQQLQEELEESNDRVAYLEVCMEKTENLEEQLADTLKALHEVQCFRYSRIESFSTICSLNLLPNGLHPLDTYELYMRIKSIFAEALLSSAGAGRACQAERPEQSKLQDEAWLCKC